MWIDEGAVRDEASDAVRRGRTKRSTAARRRAASSARSAANEAIVPGSASLDEDPMAALTKAVGAQRAARLGRRLDEAAEDFDAERYDDAVRLLRPIVREAPSVAVARELLGLSLYRLERWKPAIVELEAFRTLTNSTEQHPVLADCYRAQRRWTEVDDLWEELRAVSPSAALVTEGRIVVAGSRADRGDLAGALSLLSSGWSIPKRPQDHHLRRAYALADLYERAGDIPRARELFGWVARMAPDLGDARRRLRMLG